MWPTLLLFAFCLNVVDSFSCFKNETTIKREELKVLDLEHNGIIDEYHCKMECAGDDDCHSYSYDNGLCVFACGGLSPHSPFPFPPMQYAKKEDAKDCIEIDEPQPSSTYANYVATVLAGQTPLDYQPTVPFKNVNPCPYGSLLDIILPNNTHRVYGSGASSVIWERKLGTWQFVKQTFVMEGTSKNTTYTVTNIRAAKCYTVNPEQFTDTSSCGGSLPTRDVNANTFYVKVGSGKVEKFGVYNYCTEDAEYIQVFTDNYVERPETSVTKSTRVMCVDKSWILLFGRDGSFVTTHRITAGTCVNKTKPIG